MQHNVVHVGTKCIEASAATCEPVLSKHTMLGACMQEEIRILSHQHIHPTCVGVLRTRFCCSISNRFRIRLVCRLLDKVDLCCHMIQKERMVHAARAKAAVANARSAA